MAGKNKKTEDRVNMFFEAVGKLAKSEGLTEDEVIECFEDAVAMGFQSKGKIDVELDRETGEVYVSTVKDVVEEVTDPDREISLEEALEYDEEFNVGDEFLSDITPKSFDECFKRVDAAKIRQQLQQKVSEKSKERTNELCEQYVNEIVTCEVQDEQISEDYDTNGRKIKRRTVNVLYNRRDGVLMDQDIIPEDKPMKYGDRIKAILMSVPKTETPSQEVTGKKRRNPRESTLRLSRTCDIFLIKLLEREVPEIKNQIIEIKGVARKPGKRAKVAVYSNDPMIDPISSCVGEGGARIQAISRELSGEKIDLVRWSPNLEDYIINSLSPAKISKSTSSIEIEDDVEKYTGSRRDKTKKVAHLVIPSDMLTLAIGGEGINVALAAKLCDCRIDIHGDGNVKESTSKSRKFLDSIMN